MITITSLLSAAEKSYIEEHFPALLEAGYGDTMTVFVPDSEKNNRLLWGIEENASSFVRIEDETSTAGNLYLFHDDRLTNTDHVWRIYDWSDEAAPEVKYEDGHGGDEDYVIVGNSADQMVFEYVIDWYGKGYGYTFDDVKRNSEYDWMLVLAHA